MLVGSESSSHVVGCALIHSTHFSSDVHRPMDKTKKKDYYANINGLTIITELSTPSGKGQQKSYSL